MGWLILKCYLYTLFLVVCHCCSTGWATHRKIQWQRLVPKHQVPYCSLPNISSASWGRIMSPRSEKRSQKKKKKPLKEGSECLACKLHLSSGDSVVLNKSEPHVSVVSLMQWPLLQHLPYMAISLRRQNPVWTHNLWGVSLTAKSGGN